MELATDVLFDFDQTTLKPSGKTALDALATQLTVLAVDGIVIIGHTDSLGSKIYNKGLSLARAEAVRDYLAPRLKKSDLARAEGRGAEDPVADNTTAAGRARNRRVQVQVTGARQP